MKSIPKKYKHTEIENKWSASWSEEKLYSWDGSKNRDENFVVDTPPPTVSGSLHIGHVFSYTHTDLVVRYQRMKGKNIMYPMGWDDNGLPTERRVQNKLSINCNPKIAYNPDFKETLPKRNKKSKREVVSRKNFIEACLHVTQEDEKAFEDLWKQLGLSIDWDQTYSTISPKCTELAQYSFLDLLEKNKVYNLEAPTMWDVDFQTALAQADIEDKPKQGAYHDIEFATEEGSSFVISTTRPELLAACIAVVAHPDDERYKDLFGKYAITPLFYSKVPIISSEHADPEKGSGIMMVCTFGDAADVDWWKKTKLPIKQVISRRGKMTEVEFGADPFLSENPTQANQNWSQLVGLSVTDARAKMRELLSADGSSVCGNKSAMQGDPKSTDQFVKYYEKGDKPIEFITTRQWFIKVMDDKEALLAQGEKIAWHPPHMKVRYDDWVKGLSSDWCISRQRYFGVPFPLWYKISESGEVDYDSPIYASRESLPVDPMVDAAPGYEENQRGEPGGFCAEEDVMDTWATSSLTPQIVSGWPKDEQKHKKLFPSDIRPQSHEIIRTWAFYTIAKAYFHHEQIPWRNIAISGWVLDPDRKKMSKSQGNVVVPDELLGKYSSDAVRYWAAKARLGVDTATDESVFKIGQKLTTKLFNASKFVLNQVGEDFLGRDDLTSLITNDLDKSLLSSLSKALRQATIKYDEFDYASALAEIEREFWNFCDYYLELVKSRSYSEGEGADSAKATLVTALNSFLKAFAPTLPFITEEIWSWYNEGSIHKEQWPQYEELEKLSSSLPSEIFYFASKVLSACHFEKSQNQKTLKWPVEKIQIEASELIRNHIERAELDIRNSSKLAGNIEFVSGGEEIEVTVNLSDTME